MSRQLENWVRLMNELRDRYGSDDPIVSQWQSELDGREAFEFRYPSGLSPTKLVRAGGRSRFGTRARRLIHTDRRGLGTAAALHAS